MPHREAAVRDNSPCKAPLMPWRGGNTLIGALLYLAGTQLNTYQLHKLLYCTHAYEFNNYISNKML